MDDLRLHGLIGGGGSFLEWVKPLDWIDINNVAEGNINLLVADTGVATYAFNCTTSTGQYSVNWGDNTTTLHDSATIAEHTYTIGTGQTCSRGYTTFKITISPVEGNLLTFKVSPYSISTQTQYHGILWCICKATNLTSLANAFYSPFYPLAVVECPILEAFKCNSSMPLLTSTSYMFSGSRTLKSVDVSGMSAVIDTTGMFTACKELQKIDVSGMTAVTSAASMFNGCDILNSIDVSTMTAITSAGNMFYGCYSLQNVDVSDMALVADASYMFYNCYTLQSMVTTNFGLNATSTNASACFTNCEQLKNINLSDTKLTVIVVKGSNGKLNKLETLTFNASSAFEGISPQIDIRYNTLTAEQLNTIFTALPTLTGKTMSITGCTGSSTCDTSIATSKGWTVTT